MTKIQNVNFFGQNMLQLDDFSQKTKSELDIWLKNAKSQIWWLLLILRSQPFNFEGSYLLNAYEKIFLAGLNQKSTQNPFRSS